MYLKQNLKALAILLICLCFQSDVFAQKSLLKKADAAFNNFQYNESLDLYKTVLKKNSTNAEAMIRIADCYRILNKAKQAEFYYDKALKTGDFEPIHIYYYAESLLKNKKYGQAKKWFSSYAKVNSKDKRAKRFLASIENIDELMKDSLSRRLSALNINSYRNEFKPQIKGNRLWYLQTVGKEASANEDDLLTNTVKVNRKSHSILGGMLTGESLVELSEIGDLRSITQADNKTLIETGKFLMPLIGKDKAALNYGTTITKASVDGKRLNTYKDLAFINPSWYYSDPFISKDGRSLYFSSDMPGGFGGMDLYVSYYGGGIWSEPVNLGEEINTEGNEISPVLNNDGSLYFSSDGQGGLGGFDIYQSDYIGSGWKKVTNLAYPINSNSDDIEYTIAANTDFGILTSTREGNEDLFIYKYSDDIERIIALKGRVIENGSERPIYDALVKLYAGDNEVAVLNTDENGSFKFDLVTGKEYKVFSSSRGFNNADLSINTNELSDSEDEITLHLKMDEVMVLAETKEEEKPVEIVKEEPVVMAPTIIDKEEKIETVIEEKVKPEEPVIEEIVKETKIEKKEEKVIEKVIVKEETIKEEKTNKEPTKSIVKTEETVEAEEMVKEEIELNTASSSLNKNDLYKDQLLFRGLVIDANNKPINGVNVDLKNKYGKVVNTYTTNEDGLYEFVIEKGQSYVLKGSAEAFESNEKAFKFKKPQKKNDFFIVKLDEDREYILANYETEAAEKEEELALNTKKETKEKEVAKTKKEEEKKANTIEERVDKVEERIETAEEKMTVAKEEEKNEDNIEKVEDTIDELIVLKEEEKAKDRKITRKEKKEKAKDLEPESEPEIVTTKTIEEKEIIKTTPIVTTPVVEEPISQPVIETPSEPIVETKTYEPIKFERVETTEPAVTKTETLSSRPGATKPVGSEPMPTTTYTTTPVTTYTEPTKTYTTTPVTTYTEPTTTYSSTPVTTYTEPATTTYTTTPVTTYTEPATTYTTPTSTYVAPSSSYNSNVTYVDSYPTTTYSSTPVATYTEPTTYVDPYSSNVTSSPVYSEDVLFKVQIGAFSKPKSFSGNYLLKAQNIANVSEEMGTDGLYKYMIGQFYSIAEAKQLRNQLKGAGLDGYIVAYHQGERITIKRANQIMAQR